MDTNTKIAIGAGAGAAIALLAEHVYKGYLSPERSANDSIINTAFTPVANAANRIVSGSNCAVSNIRTPYPILNNGNLQDGPSGNNRLDGIHYLAREIARNPESADIICALASCESMDGNLRVHCFNCSLFNITHPGCNSSTIRVSGSVPPVSDPRAKPSTMVGVDRVISFVSHEDNQVNGFRACIIHFMGYVERKGVSVGMDVKTIMRNRDWDQFMVFLAKIRYGTHYIRAVTGTTVRDNFIKQRYDRLVARGLLQRPPS